MTVRHFVSAAAFVLLVTAVALPVGLAAAGQAPSAPAAAVDVSGKWTAALETPVGTFNYTYTLKVEGEKVTGTAAFAATGDFPASSVAIAEGKIAGRKVSFAETMSLMGMEIRIDYTGEIVSADEIKFTRQVGEFATEQFVAKRAKN